MLKLTPILLAVVYGLLMYQFSAWRTKRALDANSTELADPRLRALTDKMARSLDIQRVPVRIYEIAPVNGLAAPDGRIFITRGFYDRYARGEVSAEEMASVIAHELGHVALGHSRRRMIDFSGQNAVRVALMGILGRLIPVVGVWIANGLATLLMSRLSRQDEYEADAYAAALLTQSGIGTEPQRSLLQKLSRITGASAGGMPAWLMSHPRTEDRVAAIEALDARWAGQLPRD